MDGSWLKDNAHRLEETSALATIGYGLAARPSVGGDVKPRVCAGLRRLMQRDPFPGDRLSFLHDIRILFGIRLAAESVKAELPEARPGSRRHSQSRLQAADRFHELAQRHVYATLARKPTPLGNLQSLISGRDLDLALWMIDRGTASVTTPPGMRECFSSWSCAPCCAATHQIWMCHDAALLLWAADDVVGSSIDQVVLSRSHSALSYGGSRRPCGGGAGTTMT